MTHSTSHILPQRQSPTKHHTLPDDRTMNFAMMHFLAMFIVAQNVTDLVVAGPWRQYQHDRTVMPIARQSGNGRVCPPPSPGLPIARPSVYVIWILPGHCTVGDLLSPSETQSSRRCLLPCRLQTASVGLAHRPTGRAVPLCLELGTGNDEWVTSTESGGWCRRVTSCN